MKSEDGFPTRENAHFQIRLVGSRRKCKICWELNTFELYGKSFVVKGIRGIMHLSNLNGSFKILALSFCLLASSQSIGFHCTVSGH